MIVASKKHFRRLQLEVCWGELTRNLFQGIRVQIQCQITPGIAVRNTYLWPRAAI
jgi:hypothetical protein